ncbi:nuclear transport factor 2 family protein [uncultured Arcticibacterium sp.]|uniref:nuclear transport factor 2 family protein n=1 Tax=uncultured Arcticibacterium sp. TaxID=2173042 RepID=UPI0030F86339
MKKVLVLLLLSITSFAQNTPDLKGLILEKDSLFWKGYNTCDYSLMEQFLATDVEFYHDKGGLMLGSEPVIEATRKNICGDVNNKITRQAIIESIEVYPLENNGELYGAVMRGEHYFYQNGRRTGSAKFNHLWLLEENAWLMHRILSFDHQASYENSDQEKIRLTENELSQFVGSYKSQNFGVVNVEQSGANLLIKSVSMVLEVSPKTENIFFVKDRDLEFQFVKGVRIDVIEKGAKVDEVIFIKP